MKDDAAYAALGTTGYDVVCQFMAFTPEQMARDIATFAGRAGQYVFIPRPRSTRSRRATT